mgnify:CR=1 FL=1|tara:strand:- start:262 stop:603 length:342 start_codon:yes stop_codon:yes gene_type:complete
MKITKARLKEIIKEEIEEAIGVYGNPRMAEMPGRDFSLPGRDFGPSVKKGKSRKKTQAELPGDMYKKMMKVAGRGTQVEEPSTKVKEFLDIIASANMTSKEKEELMKALGAEL